MAVELRDYQQVLLQKLRKSQSRFQSTLIQSPTGTGKSRIIEHIVRSLDKANIDSLTLVPSIELLDNVTQYFSDLTPGIIHRDTKTNWGSSVIVGNVQSVHSRLDLFQRVPKYLLVDECKHSRAATWEKIINYFKDNGSKVIGFDATPCRGDGQGFAGVFDDLVLGESVSWHIENGYLSPFEYYAEPQEFNFLTIVNKFSDKLNEQAKILDHPEIIQNRVKRWADIAYGEKTLYYATTIRHAQNVSDAFNEFGLKEFGREISRCISSETPKELRKEYFNQFKNGEILVLTNVKIFTEGVDVPDCTCVQVDKFMNSYADVMQIWGRGLRPGKDKVAKLIDHTGLASIHLKPDAPVKWKLDEGLILPARKPTEDAPIVCDHCGHEIEPSRLKFYALNPGINVIQCTSCGEYKELKRRIKKGSEVPLFIGGDLQILEATNNILAIYRDLRTFYTKKTRSGKSYKKHWLLYRLDEIDDLTIDEIHFALGTVFEANVIRSYCTKRGLL